MTSLLVIPNLTRALRRERRRRIRPLSCHSRTIIVAGKQAIIPDWLPPRGWSLSEKGYLIYTSRGKASGIKRGARAHRLAVERMIGRPLEPHEHVHHQDFDKLNCCGCNMLLVPVYFNPSPSLRDPYTGEFMSAGAFERRYGACA